MGAVVRFEWDSRKAKSNLRKHGVSFEEARSVFNDRDAKLEFDDDHSELEDRFLLIGVSEKDRVLLVSHCYRRGELVRIFSARKASPSRRLTY
jgi:uncharacterized protein